MAQFKFQFQFQFDLITQVLSFMFAFSLIIGFDLSFKLLYSLGLVAWDCVSLVSLVVLSI